MKGRCRTCKTWSRNNRPFWNIKYGLCTSPKIIDADGYSEDTLYSDFVLAYLIDGDPAGLETGELFGCIHHTPLPEGETK